MTKERERKGWGETCITRTRLRPYDTLTGFKVVSLRHTGAATLISSRGGPVPCWKEERGEGGRGKRTMCRFTLSRRRDGRSAGEGGEGH